MIEGIISMIILSTLLSVGVIVSLNIYKSLPKYSVQQMKGVLGVQMDSLVGVPVVDDLVYPLGQYQMIYTTEKDGRFENIRVAKGVLIDSLGIEVSKQRLILAYE